MIKRMTGTIQQQLQEYANFLNAYKNDLVCCRGKMLSNVWFCMRHKYPNNECYTNTTLQHGSFILYKEVIHKESSSLWHRDIYSYISKNLVGWNNHDISMWGAEHRVAQQPICSSVNTLWNEEISRHQILASELQGVLSLQSIWASSPR